MYSTGMMTVSASMKLVIKCSRQQINSYGCFSCKAILSKIAMNHPLEAYLVFLSIETTSVSLVVEIEAESHPNLLSVH